MRQIFPDAHDAIARHLDHALVTSSLYCFTRYDMVHSTILDIARERLDCRVHASRDAVLDVSSHVIDHGLA